MKIPFEHCPLCDSRQIAPHLQADCSRHPLYREPLPRMMQWMRCAACGHVFTDGHWTDEALSLLLSATEDNQVVGRAMETQRPVSARMIERVLPYKSQGRWLDVGFGNASLIFTAREFGFTTVGLDLRRDGVEALRKLGIEAHCCDLVDYKPDAPFDVVSMADVLEHMPFPQLGLRAAAGLLETGGVLLASMPNMDSDMWKVLDAGGANFYWGEIEHYHNFGRSRLYALLKDYGFQPVRYAVSERYRACMEVISLKEAEPT